MRYYHEVTVEQLKTFLEQLNPDDRLVPNDVKNLAIIRGDDMIGVICLTELDQSIEWYDDYLPVSRP